MSQRTRSELVYEVSKIEESGVFERVSANMDTGLQATFRVEIHGALASELWESLDVAVETPEEVLRLMEANRPGVLNEWLRTGSYVMYRGLPSEELELVTTSNLREPLKTDEVVHVVPVVAGGFWDVVLGVIAIISAVVSIVLAFTYAPPEDLSEDAVAPQGDVNVTRAGAIVPVGYGRTRTGSVVVSSERAVRRFSNRAAEAGVPDPFLVLRRALGDFVDSGELGVVTTTQSRLRSGAVRTRLIHALCEGPITAVEQVLFDGTADLTDNPGVSVENTFGFDPQVFRRSFETSSTPFTLGDILSQTRQVFTISAGVDIISFIFEINSLFEIPRGKSQPRATTVQLIIEQREFGTTDWDEVARPVIAEESFAQQLFGFDIELDRTRRWEVAVRRANEETQTDKKQDRVVWASVNEIRFNKASYDGTAISITEYTDESFGGNNPVIEWIGRWRRLRVPSNYDPVTRVYSGVWDGTYKGLRAFSNNTALVIQDILENDVFGLGDYIRGDFDRFQLFSLAQFCDGLVDNGQGGQEPRFVFNGFLRERAACLQILRDVMSAMRGQAFWDGSQVQFIVDRPRSVTHIVTSAVVVQGTIGYSGPSIEALPNSIKVSYLDENNNFEPDEVIYQDEQSISEFGLIEQEIEGVGITAPAQALRLARYVGIARGRLMSFTGTEYYASVVPGDLIQTHDTDFMGARRGGLVVSATTTQVVLDGDLSTLESGTVPLTTSTLTCVLPNGLVQSRAITALTAVSSGVQVTVASPGFSAPPAAQSQWGITTPTLSPQFFVVQSREPQGQGLYRVSCAEYDPNRLSQAETGIAIPNRPPITFEPIDFAAPPVNLNLRLRQVPEPVGLRQDIDVTWNRPPALGSGAILTYEVFLSRDGGPRQFQGSTQNVYFRVVDIEEGSYTVLVRSRTERAVSAFASAQLDVGDVAQRPVGRVTGLELFGQGNDTEFRNRDAKFTWRYSNPLDVQDLGDERFGADSALPSQLLRDFTIRVIDVETGLVVREETGILNNEYTYTLERNVEDGGPRRTFTFEVFARDTFNNVSVPDSITVSNPPPALPVGLTVTEGFGSVFVDFTAPEELDFAGFEVHASTVSGYTPSDATLRVVDNSTFTAFEATIGVELFIRVGLFDTFGRQGLNYSSEIAVTPRGRIDTTPPAVPVILNFTSQFVLDSNSTQLVELTVELARSAEEDLAFYEIDLRETALGPFIQYVVPQTEVGVNPTLLIPNVRPNTLYEVRARAVDERGNKSAFTAVQSHTTAQDTGAPGSPTGLAAVASFRNIFLTWANPSDADLALVRVYEGATSVFAAATAVADTLSEAFTRSGLATGQQRFYWVQAIDTSGNQSSVVGPVDATTVQTQSADYADLSVVRAKIADLAVDNAKIANLSADKLTAGTALAGSITVSNTTLSDTTSRAANPATRINAQTTQILPGLINISGSTTLANWRQGGDLTRIAGGQLSANTVSTEKLTVGNRNVTLEGVQFTPNSPSNNAVAWTAGRVSYINDAGTAVSFNISAGNSPVTIVGTSRWIYWTKDTTTLLTTTSSAVAFTDNTLVVAVYRGGVDLISSFGRTIIDGSQIITGSITATQLIQTAALITQEAQIQNGVVTNLKIGNVIQSNNFNQTNRTGWRLNKAGVIEGQAINIYNTAGQLIFSSGGTPLSAVSGAGSFAGLNQITSSNASTFIANAAIGSAQIGTVNANTITTGTLNTSRLNLDGLTLTNEGGQVVVRDGGIVTAKIGANAVTDLAVANSTGFVDITSTTQTVNRGGVTIGGFVPGEHEILINMSATVIIFGGNINFSMRVFNTAANVFLANGQSDIRDNSAARQLQIVGQARFSVGLTGFNSFTGQFNASFLAPGATLRIGVINASATLLKR